MCGAQDFRVDEVGYGHERSRTTGLHFYDMYPYVFFENTSIECFSNIAQAVNSKNR